MKDKRSRAKDGPDSFIAEMRKRYDTAVEADQDNRNDAVDDIKFVTIPGNMWDESQKRLRGKRPCYEFPILRSHWRQIVNDQKKARPGIKVRPVEDGDQKGAELRQGLIRNIESVSNAERAYDAAFELMAAGGFGAWRVRSKFSTDDGWDQDLCIDRITDPLSSVWLDPFAKESDARDIEWGFIEETLSRDVFKERYPKAEAVDFESAKGSGLNGWFSEKGVRIAEYFRKVPITRTLLLLSDGRTVDKDELTEELVAKLTQEGVTIARERVVKTKKVVSSIVSGVEEIDGPYDLPFDRIPIIPIWANRFYIDGKWVWCGMVRFSRDPQKLVNYNLTTAQEVVSKQPKSPYLVTPKMLEGDGIKQLWDRANAIDAPYLPYTPDPSAPGGRPVRESPPDMPAAFTMLTQISVDMLKASDGIFDASVGAKSNETSGKAILARQQEGDTATFDYQDALSFGIQATGEILLSALPKVYDTQRMVRVIGKDGAENIVKINDGVNDLSAGKYDVTVSTGPSYDTQRMEFVDALVNLSNNNPVIAQGVPDLIVGSMDFPKADEAAERLKMLLPPPIQAKLAQGKDMPPEVMQAMQQVQQQMQEIQQQGSAMQQQAVELQQERIQVEGDKAAVASQLKEIQSQQRILAAEYAQKRAELENMQLKFELSQRAAAMPPEPIAA